MANNRLQQSMSNQLKFYWNRWNVTNENVTLIKRFLMYVSVIKCVKPPAVATNLICSKSELICYAYHYLGPRGDPQ